MHENEALLLLEAPSCPGGVMLENVDEVLDRRHMVDMHGRRQNELLPKSWRRMVAKVLSLGTVFLMTFGCDPHFHVNESPETSRGDYQLPESLHSLYQHELGQTADIEAVGWPAKCEDGVWSFSVHVADVENQDSNKIEVSSVLTTLWDLDVQTFSELFPLDRVDVEETTGGGVWWRADIFEEDVDYACGDESLVWVSIPLDFDGRPGIPAESEYNHSDSLITNWGIMGVDGGVNFHLRANEPADSADMHIVNPAAAVYLGAVEMLQDESGWWSTTIDYEDIDWRIGEHVFGAYRVLHGDVPRGLQGLPPGSGSGGAVDADDSANR
jgi:hypothetical protein